MNKKTILVVDDDSGITARIKDLLETKKYVVTVKNDAQGALDAVKNASFNLIMLDLKLPDADGISLLKKIKAITPNAYVVILTGYPSSDSINQAMAYGACDYLVKPFDSQKLFMFVEHWIAKNKDN